MLPALVLAVALVAYSTATNRQTSRDATYLARNLAAAIVLLVVARLAGLSWADLGLGGDDLAAGWRWGRLAVLVVAVGTAVAGAVAGAVPRLEQAIADPRADLPPRRLGFHVLVRIPVGTAAFEELAFRGVLLAAFAQAVPVAGAVVGQAIAFGLWHVEPTRLTLRTARPGRSTDDGSSEVPAVVAAVVATAAAGVGLGVLRVHTGSLLAPAMAHAAVNAFALLLAAVLRAR